MTTLKPELSRLSDIGPTIERRLNDVGIYTREQIVEVGAVKAHQMICMKHPNQAIPVCYYLYSLQEEKLKHYQPLNSVLALRTAARSGRSRQTRPCPRG